jgi:hypothetical protein
MQLKFEINVPLKSYVFSFYFLSVFRILSICSGVIFVHAPPHTFGFIFQIFSLRTSLIIGLTIETIVELNELVILFLSSGFLFCTKIQYPTKRK